MMQQVTTPPNLPTVRGKYRQDVNLSNTTWFRVGGNAEVIFKPEDTGDLSHFLMHIDKTIQINILGLCSNVIIRDKGIRGVVIKLGKNFTNIEVNNDIISVGCAVTDYNFAHFLAEQNLSGLEFLVGIPGSIGGAIAMNAGCYGNEIADHLLQVEAVNRITGKVHTLSSKSLGPTYRHNNLADEFIFTKAIFKLNHVDDAGKITEKMAQISKERELSQPIHEKTGGSTFKNPVHKKAWELIDQAGFRGYKLGGAQVSAKHPNFLINTGTATALDLETLGDLIKRKVQENSGIELEWEIKRIGNKR